MHLRNVVDPNYVIRRHKPTNLVIRGDEGLSHESGDRVDLHVLLTGNSNNVKLIPVVTNIMRASGLMHGSIALVDRSIRPRENSLVMVRFNGDEIIRHLKKKDNQWRLCADDPRVDDIIIGENDVIEKLGVVTASIIIMHKP